MAKYKFCAYEDENIEIEFQGPSIMSTGSDVGIRFKHKNGFDFQDSVDSAFVKMEYIKFKVSELNNKKSK